MFGGLRFGTVTGRWRTRQGACICLRRKTQAMHAPAVLLLALSFTLLLPSYAFADVFQIDLSESRLRLYDCYTSALNDETLGSDIAGYRYKNFLREITDLEYKETVSLTYGTSSISGYISPSTEYTEVYWKSELFDGADSALNNPPLVLYIPLGSTALPKGYRFRVSFSGMGWTIRYLNGSNYTNTQFSANVYRAFSGSSLADLQECTYSEGGYVAPKNSRVIALALQTTNRTGTRLLENHQYYLYSQISLQIDIPDATAQEINDQSVINTEEINDTIATQTEAQTEQLMDTTGSDSVATQQVTQGQQVFENLNFVTGINQALNNMQSAIVSQDVNTGVPFPGIQMAGFNIPAETIDPTTMMPEIMPYVRTVLTFVFCAAFISHIIHLIQAIFGITEYGDMVLSEHSPDFGPAVSKQFKPDYSINEDLGF